MKFVGDLQLAHFEAHQTSAGAYVEEQIRVNVPPDHFIAIHEVRFQHQSFEIALDSEMILASAIRIERDRPNLSSFLSGQSEHVLAGFVRRFFQGISNQSVTETYIDSELDSTDIKHDYTNNINRTYKLLYGPGLYFSSGKLYHRFDPPIVVDPLQMWLLMDSNFPTKSQQVDVDIWFTVIKSENLVEKTLFRRQFA